MSLAQIRIVDFVVMCKVRSGTGIDEFLADEFVFLDGGGGWSRTEFIWHMGAYAPWEDVRVLAVVIEPRKSVALFEGIDPVTNLGHRVAWIFDHDDDRILRIRSVSTIADLGEREVWSQ
jgi:hypothetical protein